MPSNGAPLTYGDLVQILGGQGLGIIAILFSLPSALPISAIPGISFVFGLPIVFIAIHLILGKHKLWLPAKLAKRTITREKLQQTIKKTLPILKRVEFFLKPRLDFFSTPIMYRCHGIVLLMLSLLLLLPIPFSNFIFASLIIFFGFGIAEKDGVFLALAYVGSLLYLSILIWISHEIIKSFF